jgi:hypothetical protein
MEVITGPRERVFIVALLAVAVLCGAVRQMIPLDLNVPTVQYANDMEVVILRLNWDLWLSDALMTSSIAALGVAVAVALDSRLRAKRGL